MKNHNETTKNNNSMNILDLDKLENDKNIDYEEMIQSEDYLVSEESDPEPVNKKKSALDIFLNINWHLVLLIVFILSVILIVFMIRNWGKVVDLNEIQIDEDPNIDPYIEVLDNILPHTDAEGSPAAMDGVTKVVLFGNDPFAADYGTSSNVGEMIADLSGATVYNCAVSGSHLATTYYLFNPAVDPMDAFNFYWLTAFLGYEGVDFCDQSLEKYPDALPPEAEAAYRTLCSIDFSTVDVIGIMYDASDYLEGRSIFNPENDTDIQTYYGNMNAGIQLLQETFPHIRIIIMSPTYAYAVDENGEYVDSDIHIYDEYPLSTYSLMLDQCAAGLGVSYVDNFYGTVNINNASDYLIDNVHLNMDGRKKVAERFVYALQYYD